MIPSNDSLARIHVCDALARMETRELFGNRRNLPADESAIVFNMNLSHSEKMERLTAIRQAKAERRTVRNGANVAPAAPQTFENRISAGDMIRARGMGVVLMVILALFALNAAAQSDSTVRTVQDATAEHLKVCHHIHKFALESVDRMPYKSPLNVIKEMKDPKSMSESCIESENSIIEPWQGMNDTDKKKQEDGWTKKLGFPFDEVVEDYNFFKWMAANTTDGPSQ